MEKPPLSQPRPLTVKEACDYLTIGRTSFYLQVATGALKIRKIGRRSVVEQRALDEFLRSRPSRPSS